MTEQQQPGNQPGPHYYSPPPQLGQTYPQLPAAPPKRKTPTWAIVTAAVVLGVCGIGVVAAIAGGAGQNDPPAPGQREAPAEPAADKPDPPDPPDPVFAELDPDDIELSIKTLEKQCFGSAGCNIVFRIELAYDGPELDPSITYEVTYEVTGGDDPYISTLTVNGDEYSTSQEEFIGTPSSSAELDATVTDVSEF